MKAEAFPDNIRSKLTLQTPYITGALRAPYPPADRSILKHAEPPNAQQAIDRQKAQRLLKELNLRITLAERAILSSKGASDESAGVIH
jgi:hypothetical protein